MTVEEALVTLLAALAGVLLFLGLAQALDNRLPRQSRPGRRPREDPRRSPRGEAPSGGAGGGPPPADDGGP